MNICCHQLPARWYKGMQPDNPQKGTGMPYQDERSRMAKLVMILLTILVVGGAIYWAMASSD